MRPKPQVYGDRRDIQHVVSVSGGKDSTATYLLALEYAQKHGHEFQAVMADTGNEHPVTIEYVRNLSRRTGGPEVQIVKADFSEQIARKRMFIARDNRVGRRNGKRIRWSNKAKRRALSILHPTGNPFLDLCLWKGRFPSSGAQFCTEELKIAPIMEQIVMPLLDNGLRVLSWQGMRAEESRRRAAQPRFENRGGGYWIWRPIHRWSVAEVFDIHRRHGLAPNPLYKKGMTRVGCTPCINCRKAELREIASRFSDHIEARIPEWERLVSKASKRGYSTFFHKTDDVGGLTDMEIWKIVQISETVEWSKTTYGGRQYDLFATTEPPACASAYGLCE